jgi:hypothetical protein
MTRFRVKRAPTSMTLCLLTAAGDVARVVGGNGGGAPDVTIAWDGIERRTPRRRAGWGFCDEGRWGSAPAPAPTPPPIPAGSATIAWSTPAILANGNTSVRFRDTALLWQELRLVLGQRLHFGRDGNHRNRQRPWRGHLVLHRIDCRCRGQRERVRL